MAKEKKRAGRGIEKAWRIEGQTKVEIGAEILQNSLTRRSPAQKKQWEETRNAIGSVSGNKKEGSRTKSVIGMR